MKRGRPVISEVRERLIELLAVIGKGYGYVISKTYNEIFNPCTKENIYYNLKKGVKLGEFEVESIKQEHGKYSWGTVVEKTYYKLGPNAKPKGNAAVKKYFEEKEAAKDTSK